MHNRRVRIPSNSFTISLAAKGPRGNSHRTLSIIIIGVFLIIRTSDLTVIIIIPERVITAIRITGDDH